VKPSSLFVRISVLAVIVLITFASSAVASQYIVLYRFQGTPDGANATGDLLVDAAGNLYGTTSAGGANGQGTVYELVPPPAPGGAWTETILHSFASTSADGHNPLAGLVRDAAGNFYGTTFGGGTSFDGTVFELSPPSSAGGAWTETVLYNFTGGPDGGAPQCKLLLAKNGSLVGTAFNGGADGVGAVFMLTPPASSGGAWTERVLYSFTGGNDGAHPWPGVVVDKSGNLYGVTEADGVDWNGTAFQLSPPAGGVGPWVETTLHSFGPTEGANPVGELLLDAAGNVYGMTNLGPLTTGFGWGEVFQLVPPASKGGAWTENILYTFTGGTDGGNPYSGLVFDSTGDLLGVNAYQGGAAAGGAIFKLSPSGGTWTETTLHDFSGGLDGLLSYSTLVRGRTGAFYGASILGGGSRIANYGTVYQVRP